MWVGAGLLASLQAAMAGAIKVTLLGTGTPTPRLTSFSASTRNEKREARRVGGPGNLAG